MDHCTPRGSLLSNGTMAYNRQIEGEIMSRFMEAGLADSLQDEVPMQYESHFAPLLKSMMKRVNLSVAETMHVPEALIVECEDH